jgi:IS30 family transposase
VAKLGAPRREELRAEVLRLLKLGFAGREIMRSLTTSDKMIRWVVAEYQGNDLPKLEQSGRRRDDARDGEIAELLRAGVHVTEAARRLGVSNWTIRHAVLKLGGVIPAPVERSKLRLSLAEREEISRRLVQGWSFRQIADLLERSPSTVSREVNDNGGRKYYRAWAAERHCAIKARRPRVAKLVGNPKLRKEVEERLKRRHSPRQIALCLMAEYDDPNMHISHEAIYQSLFIQGRGALRQELTKCLRTGRAMRRPQNRAKSFGRIRDMVLISERPAEVEDRAVPGHWEGDLIVGPYGRSAIATLVERSTRYVMLAKISDQRAETVRVALEKLVKRLPSELFKSLTWDRGNEMAEHAKFTMRTNVDVYFCDPHSPWQRGSNENTNGLLRQYFPKGTDLSVHSQRHLDAVARELNERPRETLGLKTPAYMLNELIVALTD